MPTHTLASSSGASPIASQTRPSHWMVKSTRSTPARKGFPGSLHGGSKGFDKRKWNAEKLNPHARRHRRRGDAVRLSYSSADGEEGYPGTVQVQVVYSLSDSCTPLGASGRHETGDWHCVGELVQSITGWTTDKPTVLNLAQHSYFNLKGHGSGSVLDHELAMPTATRVLPVDSARIPTGEFKPVGGAFDFLTSRRIGERISEVRVPAGERGYDHCFVLHSRERASHASKAESGELSGSCLHLLLVPRALSTRCRRQMRVGESRDQRRLSQTPPVEGQWRLPTLRLACRSTHRTSSTGRTEVRKGQRMHDMVACAWRREFS